MALPSAMPFLDEPAFIFGNSPESGDSEAGQAEKDSNGNIACGETAPGEMWNGNRKSHHEEDDSEDH
jgi:hypothetical protein